MKKNNVVIPPAAHKTTEEIWQKFSQQLTGFIAKRISDPNDIEDILQDIFYKIHAKRTTLRNNDKLISWIYQITRNVINDYYRRSNILPERYETFENIDNSDYQALSPCLVPFVNQLSNSEKSILLKVDVKKIPQKRLAEEAGISYSTLKNQVQRTRKKLRKMFLSCCELEFDKRGQLIESSQKNSECNC